ncbi:MAG: hypothetical protein RJB56_237 [Actinomycetota bacterium]|jgi:hypothetical protein
MSELLVPQADLPWIYAYTTPEEANLEWKGSRVGFGLLKVGYTSGDYQRRVADQFPTKSPRDDRYQIVFAEKAVTKSGMFFKDHAVHSLLVKKGIHRIKGTEWFECTVEELRAAVLEIQKEKPVQLQRYLDYKLRPEQKQAVLMTAEYFRGINPSNSGGRPPHFLWNAKMRFGKTFAAYHLAKEMGWTKILVLTFKPAVLGEWQSQLEQHIDFEGWQFIGGKDRPADIVGDKPYCWFLSFQDIGGKQNGQIKDRLEPVYETEWDCIILDEYHFGSWNDRTKNLYDRDAISQVKAVIASDDDLDEVASVGTDVIEDQSPLKTKNYLYLTGTPFRALTNGEFLENQIFTWSYADEQREKINWRGPEDANPYADLPQMVMLTYELPSSAREIAMKGDLNEFDLNEFFRAAPIDKENLDLGFKFVHETEVQQWLAMVRGQYREEDYEPAPGVDVPMAPFANSELIGYLNHTLWYLPSVGACKAMESLLKMPQNTFFHDYEVIVAAGTKIGIGAEAVKSVKNVIGSGLTNKTITLTFAKLVTGVSIPPWSGVFMLRNTSNPESYFQTVFRVQTPWTLSNTDGKDPNSRVILKDKCYVFDYAPNRALKFISEYAERIDIKDDRRLEARVAEFVKFLPVLAYDGSRMREINATEILSISSSGIGTAMLTRRWKDTRMVVVNNFTLEKLLEQPDLVQALQEVEQFRALDLSEALLKVINTEKALNPLKKERKPLSEKQKKSDKESKDLKKELREKLMWFVARIPVFMYLTDYREQELQDVIRQMETNLFTRVTGLKLTDFDKLCELGVFNKRALSYSIFQFRLAEEGSLNYAGVDRTSSRIGGFDTVVDRDEAAQIVHRSFELN